MTNHIYDAIGVAIKPLNLTFVNDILTRKEGSEGPSGLTDYELIKIADVLLDKFGYKWQPECAGMIWREVQGDVGCVYLELRPEDDAVSDGKFYFVSIHSDGEIAIHDEIC